MQVPDHSSWLKFPNENFLKLFWPYYTLGNSPPPKTPFWNISLFNLFWKNISDSNPTPKIIGVGRDDTENIRFETLECLLFQWQHGHSVFMLFLYLRLSLFWMGSWTCTHYNHYTVIHTYHYKMLHGSPLSAPPPLSTPSQLRLLGLCCAIASPTRWRHASDIGAPWLVQAYEAHRAVSFP